VIGPGTALPGLTRLRAATARPSALGWLLILDAKGRVRVAYVGRQPNPLVLGHLLGQ
jgi:hypothetical protein